ncbi:MAG TPA: carboxypeptidase-like regulatory domain-containing protein [Streptosporangiaceae bacterium]
MRMWRRRGHGRDQPVANAPAAPSRAVLTGTIAICSGLPYSMLLPANRPPKFFSAPATVVLRHGATVVARERVGRNQPYHFAAVPPGRYVVRAWYTGGNVSTFRAVTVAGDAAVRADLPNLCR